MTKHIRTLWEKVATWFGIPKWEYEKYIQGMKRDSFRRYAGYYCCIDRRSGKSRVFLSRGVRRAPPFNNPPLDEAKAWLEEKLGRPVHGSFVHF